ncbi:MAG: hypothetical protein KA352_09180, partial [Flavobacteriales bacterium]|nr:hypothetical protein [Flavobacteriales bacterium]
MPTPHLRAKALEDVLDRRPKHTENTGQRISEYFGSSVFNEEAMRMFLTEDAYFAVRQAIH